VVAVEEKMNAEEEKMNGQWSIMALLNYGE